MPFGSVRVRFVMNEADVYSLWFPLDEPKETSPIAIME